MGSGTFWPIWAPVTVTYIILSVCSCPHLGCSICPSIHFWILTSGCSQTVVVLSLCNSFLGYSDLWTLAFLLSLDSQHHCFNSGNPPGSTWLLLLYTVAQKSLELLFCLFPISQQSLFLFSIMKTVRFGFFMYKSKFKSYYPSSLITEIPLFKFSKWFPVRAHLNLVFSLPLHNGITLVL